MGPNNTSPHYYRDVIELTAVPDSGWGFSMWSGALCGGENPTLLTVDGNKVVNATFID